MLNISKRRRDGTRTKIKIRSPMKTITPIKKYYNAMRSRCTVKRKPTNPVMLKFRTKDVKTRSMGDHKEFLKRIEKTLYYGYLPTIPCLSLPVTEISCELWSVSQRGRSLRRLHVDEAAGIARQACVSPCALVLAILYLERLKTCNPDYVANTPPTDLFLISLMVSNKFLQDDGEDDGVMCSEWAASAGIPLKQLKKLEINFLNAIDWNVFVSEHAFETGLRWLERQVCLKQARLRGFFTYGDLAASCDRHQVTALAGWLGSACAALALAYLGSVATLLASTLVLSRVWLPTAPHTSLSAPAFPPLPLDVQQPNLPLFDNATLADTVDMPDSVLEEPATLKCCTQWIRYQETKVSNKNWYDSVTLEVWEASEPWWSRSGVVNWLYQSSLINPTQRWLENVIELGEFIKSEFLFIEPSEKKNCREYMTDGDRACVKQWLNFSKMSALLVSVSDR